MGGELNAEDRVILLVEDNADDAALTERAFRKANLANPIVRVTDGGEALDWLFCHGQYEARTPSGLPALVLLDLRLPRLDGLDVLRAVRADERTRHLPVVVLTSSKEDEDVVRGYSLGANSFVRKPLGFNDFVSAVRQVGLYWLLVNQPP